jgi:D-3-phosphoglycerate dehydrogenase / 2-oxoglutarate reductase
MRILAVGDSYMPARYFATAFEDLGDGHSISYLECDVDATFSPSSSSELRLREYLGSPDQLTKRMSGVEVLAVHGAPVTDAVLDASHDLRLVCCARGGPVNVDADAVAERGLVLVNTPGKNAEAVADMTMGFLVMLARGFPKAQRFLADGGRVRDNWEGAQFFGHDLERHTLGLIGYGQVGQRVAERALPFGLRVLVYDPFASADDPNVKQVDSLGELLAQADFVSLHARVNAANQRMINAAELAAMRPGAFLINTAREALVDEDALDAALASGHLGGVALDVFEPPENGRGPRFLRHENVVLTPHIGGATHETLARGAEMIAAEIARFAAGEPLHHVVTRAAATE